MYHHIRTRLAAIAIALVVTGPTSAQTPFPDVPADHWARDSVAQLLEKGLVDGYPDGLYKGDRAADRKSIAKILAKMLAGVEQAIADTNDPAALVGLRRIGGALNANLVRLGAAVPGSTISYADPDIAPTVLQTGTDELLWAVQRRARSDGSFDEIDASKRYDAAALFTPAVTEYENYMESIGEPYDPRWPRLESIVAFNDGTGDESVPRRTVARMAARVSIEIETAQTLVSVSDDAVATGGGFGVAERQGRIVASEPTTTAVEPRRFSGVFGEAGYRIAQLPDRDIGIRNFGVDFNPLHSLSIDLDGPFFKGGFFTPVDLPEPFGPGWTLTVGGTVAQLRGSERETIAGFNQGQAPTYIDLTGVSGFSFNENSLINIDSDYDTYKVETDFSRPILLNDNVSTFFSTGLFFQHTQLHNNIALDTNFQNGTFFNTVNERITQNMLGATAGLEFTLNPAEAWLVVFGGYFGLAHVWGEYRGSDCGDGSLATPGCDGVLFSNSGIGANNSGLGLVGGLKAALAFYSFCRENPAAVTAALIQNAADALKESCVEFSVGGSVDSYPGQQVNQSTAIGGGSVALGLAQTVIGNVFAGIRKSF